MSINKDDPQAPFRAVRKHFAHQLVQKSKFSTGKTVYIIQINTGGNSPGSSAHCAKEPETGRRPKRTGKVIHLPEAAAKQNKKGNGKMKNMRKILCLLLVAVLVLSMCACGSKGGSDNATPKAVKPAEKDSGYVYDSVTMGTSVIPNFITGTTPAENDGACSLVFDEVFKLDANTKEVYSEILEDWHFEDENTLVMKLKDGVYFSNGDKATAEDVLYSYSSHVDRSSAYIYEFGILYDQCEIVDELTLKMKFESFYSAFFSSYTIYLYNKSWCESVGWESLEWQKPVGTGPYAVSEYKIDDRAVFTARDDYWNKENNPVAIREWVMKYYQDHSTMDMDLDFLGYSLGDASIRRFVRTAL